MTSQTGSLVQALMDLPLFESEWVLWLLLLLSVASVAVMVERWWFYRQKRVDTDAIRGVLRTHLEAGDFAAAANYLQDFDSLETNVVLYGLRDHAKGPDAVEDLLAGATRKEKQRYTIRLNFLATVASNAPFIGLFGTVLGIIRAFKDLSQNLSEANASVMAGIAEALIATAVGLLVAIPAVVAFNTFRTLVARRGDDTQLLCRTLLAQLKAEDLRSEVA